ncbi:hypothetical protein K456DRAFT_31008 [Colletotrichum gloeosporioides 23]|nr:hypothetical protein K456DRAFT_31008 [Colletotrichum gloeosporioides 23]
MGWPQENSVVFAKRDPRSAQGSDVPSAVLTQVEAAAKRREEVGSGSEDSATQAGALLKRLALPRWRHGPLGGTARAAGGVLRGGHSAPEREDDVFYVLDRCSQLLTAILSRQDQIVLNILLRLNPAWERLGGQGRAQMESAQWVARARVMRFSSEAGGPRTTTNMDSIEVDLANRAEGFGSRNDDTFQRRQQLTVVQKKIRLRVGKSGWEWRRK